METFERASRNGKSKDHAVPNTEPANGVETRQNGTLKSNIGKKFVQVPLSGRQYEKLRELAVENELSMADVFRLSINQQHYLRKLAEQGFVLAKVNGNGKAETVLPIPLDPWL